MNRTHAVGRHPMKGFLFATCGLFAGALLQPSPARAGNADPAMSYQDPCLVVCPAGDSTFRMVLRNSAGVPWIVDELTLDFCDCPRVSLVPGQHSYQIKPPGCVIGKFPYSDGTDGTVLFPIAAGGVCGDSVRVMSAGMPFPSRAVASFDQDGDLVVTPDDVQQIEAKLLTADPTADFDCDGAVTSSDVAIAAAHLGHGGSTGVPPGDREAGFGFSRPPAPNPTQRETAFAIALPRRQSVEVFVADLSGRRLKTLWSGPLPAGEHRFSWNATALSGRAVPAGVYVVVARAGQITLARRLAVLR